MPESEQLKKDLILQEKLVLQRLLRQTKPHFLLFCGSLSIFLLQALVLKRSKIYTVLSFTR